MWETLKNAWKIPDLRKKILYTLMMLVIYRLMCFVPVPGVDKATVAARLAQAQAVHDSLQGLLDQLNEVSTFVTGLKTYTAGVDQAAAGAVDLSTGAAALHDSGTDPLLTTITGAEKSAAEKLLPLLTGDVSAALDALDRMAGQAAGYDLRDEAWETTTLYVIRTDFD